jgi:hypothetical protein
VPLLLSRRPRLRAARKDPADDVVDAGDGSRYMQSSVLRGSDA